MEYAVIVDAGSSGSRAFVYTWPDPVTYLADKPGSVLAEALIPIETTNTWVHKIQPGISTFRGNTSQIWRDHLGPLVRKATDIVPRDKQQETPFYFLATAGLRLLAEEERAEILQTVCSLLQKKTNFLVPECDTHVAMIDGQAEGLYGWLGLNYLVHQKLSKRWNNFDDTYGFLDMGGASAQLAFAVDQDTQHKNDMHTVQMLTAGGDPIQWHIFVTTWLGYGANQARTRLRHQIISEYKPEDLEVEDTGQYAIPVFDPCMPKMAYDIVIMPNGREYIFSGSGNWAECERRVENLLNTGVPCEDEPCLFDGVHVPEFKLDGKRFVGVSEYWYTLQDLFSNNGKFDYTTLEAQVSTLCTSDWADLQRFMAEGNYLKHDGTPLTEHEVKSTCFKGAWVLSVLSKGFHFPLSPENKALEHNFKDTFQSAADIHGIEISWTMGRAVLYASSKIQPKAGHEDFKVGFTGLDGHFYQGGEVASLEQIREMQRPALFSHPWAMWFYFLAALGIFIAVFRKRITRSHQIRVLRRKLRKWLPNFEQHSLGLTADRIGYGYSYPHAGIPLATFDFDEEGMSTSRTPNRAPSRVSSRLSLNGYNET